MNRLDITLRRGSGEAAPQVISCPHCGWAAVRVGPPGGQAASWLTQDLEAHQRERHGPARQSG